MFCSEDQKPSLMLCRAQYLGAMAYFSSVLVITGISENEELERIRYLAFFTVT